MTTLTIDTFIDSDGETAMILDHEHFADWREDDVIHWHVDSETHTVTMRNISKEERDGSMEPDDLP